MNKCKTGKDEAKTTFLFNVILKLFHKLFYAFHKFENQFPTVFS